MAATIHRHYLVGVFIGVVIVLYTLSLSEKDFNLNTTAKIGGLNAPNDDLELSAYENLLNNGIPEAISASRSECATNYEKWYQAMGRYYDPSKFPESIKLGGSAYRTNECRGSPYLHYHTGIFTCFAFLRNMSDAGRTSLVKDAENHVILYPYIPRKDAFFSDPPLRRPLDPTQIFHDVTYHSLLSGPSLTAPISRPVNVTVDSAVLPLFLLTFNPQIVGNHELVVNVHFVADYLLNGKFAFPHRARFVGVSEGRICNPGDLVQNWCLHQVTGDGIGSGCQPYGEVVRSEVSVIKGKTDDISPSFLNLPLAKKSTRSPTGFWFKVGDSIEDCRDRADINRKYVSGNPCRMGDPSHPDVPIYVWMPSDKRYHFLEADEIGKCFSERGIKRYIIGGDSIARSIYGPFMSLVADIPYGADYGKHLKEASKVEIPNSAWWERTNHGLGKWNISTTTFQEWHDDEEKVARIYDGTGVFKGGGTNLFIYNAGTPGHRLGLNRTSYRKFWNDQITKEGAVAPPYMFWIGGPALQGLRQASWSKNLVSRWNKINEALVKELGFSWLEAEQMMTSVPLLSYTNEDGYHPSQNQYRMMSMVMINVICNNEKGAEVDKDRKESSDEVLEMLSRPTNVHDISFNVVDVQSDYYEKIKP
mmetsp:Transcript_18029/g.37517  ORF Transcript_18029/g.37517 Transcript_18029/m.37517 type:complete len:646 (+) Transcript_18029:71-2008(+)